MRKRFWKKVLSAVLAVSMILGNAGLPQGLKEVHAEEVDISAVISGKTQVTEDDIADMYRETTYTPQAVHDPSVIKSGNDWYVFGSHRAVAKTGDLQNWENVNIDKLFGDGNGQPLAPDQAFKTNLFTGDIAVNETAKTQTAAFHALTAAKSESREADDEDAAEGEDESGEAGNEDAAGNEGEVGNEDAAGNEGEAGNEDAAGNEGEAGNEDAAGNEGEAGDEDAAGNEGKPGETGETNPEDTAGTAQQPAVENGAEAGVQSEDRAAVTSKKVPLRNLCFT